MALAVAVVFLWPAQLGGSTRLVMVNGHSMEPTYDFGDMVITREASPSVGDIAVFEVPEGNAKGMLVIHRIIGIDDDGFYITQGDNRETADMWRLTADDIVGKPVLRLPKLGYLVWFLQQWFVVAVLLGLLTVFVLWPRSHLDPEEAIDEPVGKLADPADVTAMLPPVRWSDAEIDEALMDDAVAWLEEELAAMQGAKLADSQG